MLAADNRKAEPEIERIYWFPADSEVRLIEVLPSVPKAGDDEEIVRPFYFRANPSDGLPAPSGIAMVRPDEVRRLATPADWGDWDSAVELDGDE